MTKTVFFDAMTYISVFLTITSLLFGCIEAAFFGAMAVGLFNIGKRHSC